ncbi:MAG: tetratricopeptide repeat protein, partial [Muribaculaceae bacterium]|nr:tetratricopeptide repeat protein [Muribaculaceae bacterium]
MRRLTIILFLISLIAGNSKADSPVILRADSAYMAEEYENAVQLYRKAISEEGPSAKLYYNLGNTYYRLGEMGNAILSFERSLRIDPTDADTRENLAFVNGKITDRPGERGTFLGNALDSAAMAMRSDAWAWIAFAAFALTIAGLLTYLFLDNVTLRKLGFFGGIVTFIICAVSLFFSS